MNQLQANFHLLTALSFLLPFFLSSPPWERLTQLASDVSGVLSDYLRDPTRTNFVHPYLNFMLTIPIHNLLCNT